MSAEQFLPEIEEDMDPAETGKTGCLFPTGDAETSGTSEGGEDE